MKRLAIRISLLLITFSLGVGVQKALTSKAHVDVPESVQPAQPQVVYVDVPVLIPAASPTPVVILDYDTKKFEPYGYFGIIGNKPRQFEEVDSIGLELGEDNGLPTGSLTLGTVSGVGQYYDSQQAVFGLVTSERLFFVTAPFQSGFEYRFEGVFLRKDFPEAWAGTNRALIKGTITKSKNGRKVAEAEVKLRLEHFGC